LRTNFALFTGIIADTAVVAVGLDIDAAPLAIGQSALAGEAALALRADFSGFTGLMTFTTM
jgi:hypothetical protein